MSIENNTKITPDELMQVCGFSPADNTENIPTSLPWKAKWLAGKLEACSTIKELLITSVRIYGFTDHSRSPRCGKAQYLILLYCGR